MNIPEQLDADEEICNAATPGPWTYEHPDAPGGAADIYAKDREGLLADEPVATWVCAFNDESGACDDATFITRARTAWPEAIIEIRRLREVVRDSSIEHANTNQENIALRDALKETLGVIHHLLILNPWPEAAARILHLRKLVTP